MWAPFPSLDGQPVMPAGRVRPILLDDATLSNREVAIRIDVRAGAETSCGFGCTLARVAC